MQIRSAKLNDSPALYALAEQAVELRVSATEPFMQPDELAYAIRRNNAIFLVAEGANQLIGFIYANLDDKEVGFKQRSACIVYIVVAATARDQGVGSALYQACITALTQRNIHYVYTWARTDGDAGKFFQQHGFNPGHTYTWMDQTL